MHKISVRMGRCHNPKILIPGHDGLYPLKMFLILAVAHKHQEAAAVFPFCNRMLTARSHFLKVNQVH